MSTLSATAETEPGAVVRVRSARWATMLAALLSLVLLGAAAEIVLDAAVGHTPMVPRSPPFDSWLAGFGQSLSYDVFIPALLGSCAAYGGILVLARRRSSPFSKRWAIGLVVVLQLILFVGPVLLATDAFGYVAYARLGVLHGVNPYLHGAAAISTDPIYRYISPDWIHFATPYGPLFTLISYPPALLGIDGAVWGIKAEALLASFGTLAFTWRVARQRGLDPVWAILLVGLNPLYAIYALGGSHNDLLMLFAMMAGVSLSLAAAGSPRREAAGAAAVAASALIKATAGVVVPFMIVANRRVAPILGTVLALAIGALVGYAVFGLQGINLIADLNREGALVSSYSYAAQIAHLFGKPGVYPVDHKLLEVALMLVIVYLLYRTWRGYDWVAAAGWALLAVAVTSTWLMPWYTVWPLPLAAVTRDRRLIVAALLIQTLWVIHQTFALYGPVPV